MAFTGLRLQHCISKGALGALPGGLMRFGPFLGIAILLAILWACGFLMFHVASGLIHLLLLFAVISLVIHLFSGARAAT
jgi:Family of unknown function (DUF5670)